MRRFNTTQQADESRRGSSAAGRRSSDDPRSDGWVDPAELAAKARLQRRSWKRLPGLLGDCLGLVWGTDRRVLLVSAVLQLVGGAIVAVQVLVTKAVLDALLSAEHVGGSVKGAVLPILILAVVSGFSSVSSAIVTQQSRLLSELTTRAVWNRIIDVAGAVDLLAYEGSSFFDQMRRVQANAITRPYMLVQGVINLIGGITGVVGVAAALIAIQPILLPLLLVTGVPLWYAGRRASRMEFLFALSQSEPSRKRGYLSSVLTGRNEAKELRAFGLLRAMRERYDAEYDSYVRQLRSHLRRKTEVAVSGNLAAAVLLAGTLLLLVLLLARHDLGLAAAGAALVAIRMLASQISGLSGGLQQIFESRLFMDDLREFVNNWSSSRVVHGVVPAPRSFRSLQARDVSFSYPTGSTQAVRELSMQIDAGQVVAIVGENGSGKTTLAKLLAGLYEASAGSITRDDIDLREFEPASLRRTTAVIFQDFVRYQLSAADNIGAGQPEAMDERSGIAAAARHAGADEFLSRFPEGYDTVLSNAFKGGRDLSVGQWQRIALARAFYRDASFVILDEPTASLDPRAEAALFEKIRELLAGRTVLLISHRFSSVRYADMIYVMKEGEIVERGSHSELMARQGLYAELFTLQAAAYVDSPAS